jgi:hypothetical protein
MKPGYIVVLAFNLRYTGLVFFMSLPPSLHCPMTHPSTIPWPCKHGLGCDWLLQKKGIINKVECDSPQRLWILPAFMSSH